MLPTSPFSRANLIIINFQVPSRNADVLITAHKKWTSGRCATTPTPPELHQLPSSVSKVDMHHSFRFLIEVTFNLTLVDERVFDLTWIGNLLQLIFSAHLCSKVLLCLSIQPFSSSLVIEDATAPRSAHLPPSPSVIEIKQSQGETGPSRRESSIVRGRDAPFPVAPTKQRLSLPPPIDKGNALLLRRYSKPAPMLPAPEADVLVYHVVPARGRTMQRVRPPLYRSDSRTVCSNTASTTSEGGALQNKRSTLLRVPPFPLPHRALQRPASESRLRQKVPLTNNQKRLSSRRISSIPPRLVLDSLFYEDEDNMPH
ncbi:hypothetical protein Hypma_011106 [Hypsizygus marmoreus]|uniref:Uncharacterized protein n=1 Tax=Hypsizygus marmoreus TaxID=39966 RepID=A0A369JIR6_HYPMA|nr:hypothetical protein Hypma_011106 [Hypsizygus marmoreus]